MREIIATSDISLVRGAERKLWAGIGIVIAVMRGDQRIVVAEASFPFAAANKDTVYLEYAGMLYALRLACQISSEGSKLRICSDCLAATWLLQKAMPYGIAHPAVLHAALPRFHGIQVARGKKREIARAHWLARRATSKIHDGNSRGASVKVESGIVPDAESAIDQT